VQKLNSLRTEQSTMLMKITDVSFVGFILLTESLLCNVAVFNVFNKNAVYFRIFTVFRVYVSNMEKALS
jgi:hypothetical protein